MHAFAVSNERRTLDRKSWVSYNKIPDLNKKDSVRRQ